MCAFFTDADPGLLYVRPLADSLWGTDPATRRSTDLSPIYVECFRGIHHNAQQTTHPYWEAVAVLRGSMDLILGEERLRMRAGEVCLIPPDLPHHEQSSHRMENLWIGFSGSRMDGLDPAHALVAQGHDLIQACERLWKCAEGAYGLSGPELDGLALAALGLFLRARIDALHPQTDITEAAIHMMRAEFATLRTVGDMANRLHISEGHFSRLFRDRTGQSPLAYLTGIRMEHACGWLQRSALPVASVAIMCGFADPLYFSRLFRRHMGQSPRAYRNASHITSWAVDK